MPQLTPEQMIETQRQDWNRVASGWERWDEFFDRNMTFLNHRLVADARLRRGHRVLDLGSGTGYPAGRAGLTSLVERVEARENRVERVPPGKL